MTARRVLVDRVADAGVNAIASVAFFGGTVYQFGDLTWIDVALFGAVALLSFAAGTHIREPDEAIADGIDPMPAGTHIQSAWRTAGAVTLERLAIYAAVGVVGSFVVDYVLYALAGLAAWHASEYIVKARAIARWEQRRRIVLVSSDGEYYRAPGQAAGQLV